MWRSSHHPPPGVAKAPDFARMLVVSSMFCFLASLNCEQVLGYWLQNFIFLGSFQPLCQSHRWSCFVRICIVKFFDLDCTIDEAVGVVPCVVWIAAFPLSLVLKHTILDSAGENASDGVFWLTIYFDRWWRRFDLTW